MESKRDCYGLSRRRRLRYAALAGTAALALGAGLTQATGSAFASGGSPTEPFLKLINAPTATPSGTAIDVKSVHITSDNFGQPNLGCVPITPGQALFHQIVHAGSTVFAAYFSDASCKTEITGVSASAIVPATSPTEEFIFDLTANLR